MPPPVSATLSATKSPLMPSGNSVRVEANIFAPRSTMRPPSGMASRALTARLTSASSSSDLSTRTGHVVSGTSISNSILTCIEPASTSRMARTASAGSITVGLSGSVRENDSNCRVRFSPRVAAISIAANARMSLVSFKRFFRLCAWPLTIINRLLKSWAMPPVSWPIASIFCKCAVCRCARSSAAAASFSAVTWRPAI